MLTNKREGSLSLDEKEKRKYLFLRQVETLDITRKARSDIVRYAHSDIIFAFELLMREAHITSEGHITHLCIELAAGEYN